MATTLPQSNIQARNLPRCRSTFGAEAPALVNAYVKKLKDKLLKAFGNQNRLPTVIAHSRKSINHLQAVFAPGHRRLLGDGRHPSNRKTAWALCKRLSRCRETLPPGETVIFALHQAPPA